MPKRPREHIIEDLARSQLHQKFAKVGWSSENIDQDYGEDIFVRIFENGIATPWSFFVQSKATENLSHYFTNDQKSISFPIQATHIEHWRRFWEPVVLSIYDVSTETTYWEVVQTYLDTMKNRSSSKNRKSISVHVPTDNLLDAEGLRRLRNRTKNRFQRFEAQKEGASILIEELQKQWEVDIEYEPELGVLILPKGQFKSDPSGGLTLTAFGKFAAQFDHFKDKYGFDPQETFEGGIDIIYQIVMAYKDGAKLQVRDKDGTVINEWETLEDLQRYANRQAELSDD